MRCQFLHVFEDKALLRFAEEGDNRVSSSCDSFLNGEDVTICLEIGRHAVCRWVAKGDGRIKKACLVRYLGWW